MFETQHVRRAKNRRFGQKFIRYSPVVMLGPVPGAVKGVIDAACILRSEYPFAKLGFRGDMLRAETAGVQS